MNEIPNNAAKPLHALIGTLRQPATLRELMARCLRSIYMGDPFTGNPGAIPEPPGFLRDQVTVRELMITNCRCVVYSPTAKKTTGNLPIMLYMHGGGFVVGCSEDTDYTTRMLCYANQIVVVSVNYRLAPETTFPGALDDCEAVLRAILASDSPLAEELNIDKTSVYFSGDSAGGNLAAALALKLQDRGESISGLVLLAPWLDMNVEAYDSYNRLAPTGIVFDAPFIAYARASYARFEQWQDPLVSPIFGSIDKMPPTIILVGTEDPLVDQTLKLGTMARESKCDRIEIVIYPDMPHCFYSFPNLFSEEQDCYRKISDFTRVTRG